MCKRNEVLGVALLTAGIALLVSLLIPGGFLRGILAVILIIAGFLILRR